MGRKGWLAARIASEAKMEKGDYEKYKKDLLENLMLYYDAWAKLDEIMVEFGMNPKHQPKEAQKWLREELEKANHYDRLRK